MTLDEAAKKYLDVKFHHQGRSLAGVDCLGLIYLSAADLGVDLEDEKGYARTPDGNRLQSECDRQLTRINIDDAVNGDIYLMRFKRDPQHLAIKTSAGIIHAFKNAGKVVEHTLDDKWRARIKRAYRL